MIKIKILMIMFIILAFLNARGRCSDIIDRNRLKPPELDTFYISDTGRFKIHYDITNDNGNLPLQGDIDVDGIPDYVELAAQTVDEVRDILVNDMNYLSEPNDGNPYDIYIEDREGGDWGVNVADDNGFSYIVIDNDYLEQEFNESTHCPNQIDKMRVTLAHEFFHAIQRSYKHKDEDDDFLLEMTSMWFEDLYLPDCNEYLNWIRRDDFVDYKIFDNPTQQFDGFDLSVGQRASFGYGMALFGHYLSNKVDPDIMRLIWEEYSKTDPTDEEQDTISGAGLAIKKVLQKVSKQPFSHIWTDFISSNMLCGQFDFFNQDIYYHEDQQLIDKPIVLNDDLSNTLYVNPNNSISYIEHLNPNSASMKSLVMLSDMFLSLNFSNTENTITEDYSGYYVNRGDINSRTLINSDIFNNILSNQTDFFSIVLSSNLEDLELDINIESKRAPNQTLISNIYPNPLVSRKNFNIKVQAHQNIEDYKITIYNVLGQLVGEFSSFQNLELGYDNIINVPIQNTIVTSGIYFIELKTRNSTSLSKIVFIK